MKLKTLHESKSDEMLAIGEMIRLYLHDNLLEHLGIGTKPDEFEIRGPWKRLRTVITYKDVPKITIKHYSADIGHPNYKVYSKDVNMANPDFLEEMTKFVNDFYAKRRYSET